MTESRKPGDRQPSRRYSPSLPASPPRSAIRRRGSRAESKREVRQRVVTMPGAVQPTAWSRYAHRRYQLHSARAKAQTYTSLTPRTFAQTGVAANGQQVRSVKRSLPQNHSSPVPVRSGRRNAHRRNFLWRILGIFTLLAAIVLGLNFVLTGQTFQVAQVNVMGTHNALLVQGIQHMGIQGQNIFLLDVAALTAQIDALPLVASASLEKQLPHQLLVMVTERTPSLLWQTQQATFSVDKSGVVLAPVSETAGAARLMTVVDIAGQGNRAAKSTALHPGDQLDEADIAFAIAVFERFPKFTGIVDFTLRYDGIMPAILSNGQSDAQESGSFVVESRSGWLAYLGSANDTNPLDNRLIELQHILALAQQQQLNLATVDLRFGLRPIYTLKS